MDHRGLVRFDNAWHTVGGMLSRQSVTDQVTSYPLDSALGSVSSSQHSPCVLIGASICLWHQHPILPYVCDLKLTLTDGLFVLDKATSRLNTRATPARNFDDQ